MSKSLWILMLTVSSSFLFYNCQKDEEEQEDYWYSYGSYYESEDSSKGFVIDLDSGKTLDPTEASGINSDVSDSSRVIVYYVIENQTDEVVNAKVKSVANILTKDVLQLTEEIEDSLGYDGIILSEDAMWFSENHLNLVFGFYAYSGQHLISLVKPIGEQTDENGRQILEFKHNANDDSPDYLYNDVVSFNMKSLYTEGMDSLPFTLKWVDYDNNEGSIERTFYFNKSENEGKSYIGEPELLNLIY